MKFTVGLALLAVPGFLAAQTAADSVRPSPYASQDTARRGDSLGPVLDHTFNGPGEFVRFFLSGGTVYRAVVDRDDIQLVVEGVLPSTPPVSVIELQKFHDLSHQREYLIRAVVDGDYQLRVPFAAPLDTTERGLPSARADGSSRLRLYRDEKETRRWNYAGAETWAFGVEISGGAGQAYPDGSSGSVSGSVGAIEGCLAAQYGPGFGGYVSGCIIGIRHESPHGRAGATYVFVEPRFRLVGTNKRWSDALDAGLLLRAGLGQIDRLNKQPGLLAPGVYLNFTLLHRPHLPRVVIEAAARYAYIFSAGPETPTSVQGTLGLGIF